MTADQRKSTLASPGAAVLRCFRSILVDEPSQAPFVEADRAAYQLNLLADDEKSRVFHFCGLGNNQGTTTSVLWIAQGLSMLFPHRRTVVVDGNTLRPKIHLLAGVSLSPGLTDVLSSRCGALDALRQCDDSGLRIVSAGSKTVSDSVLCNSGLIRGFFSSILASSEMVLVDGPSIDVETKSLSLAKACDRTIVVMSSRSMHGRAVRSALNRCREAGIVVAGTILTRYRREIPEWIYKRI